MRFSKNQILLFGFAIHILAAVFSIGYHQCDELFQVYEFAGYKLGLNSAADLPWEFHEQMRSGIQPFMVYIVTKAFHFISVSNPFTVAFFMRLLMAILSFCATVALTNQLEKEISSEKLKQWLWLSVFFSWCLPCFHARFSSENFSATLFIFGLAFLLRNRHPERSRREGKPIFLFFLLSGVLFGLAFHARFQISFMIAGLLAWLLFVNKTSFKLIATLILGIVLAFILGLIFDHWLYGRWTLSWWNYLDLNLFKDKASVYGTEPFYFFFEQAFLQLIPPFSLIIIVCIIAFWMKFGAHFITWITLPFILLHFFVAHKELRFLFPVLNFLPFMMIYYLQSVETKQNKWLLFLRRKAVLKFAISVNLAALLIFTFSPADQTSHYLKEIYNRVEGERPVLYYEGNNPYNNLASLNYFRNPAIRTIDLANDTTVQSGEIYYFSEKFNEGTYVIKNGKRLERIYSNFPSWFSYLNFNGWLDRATTFSIYKLEE